MIEIHLENGSKPYVCRVGKYNQMWFAYSTKEKAELNLPRLIEGFKNYG